MRPKIEWPDGKKICATLTVAFEAFTRGGHFKKAKGLEVNLVSLSHANYGGNAGIWRILEGASTSALMTAYAGPAGHMHHMWALWREEKSLYVQQHAVLNGDLDHPFVPNNPYAYVGTRIPASKYELPFPEWRVNLSDVLAAAKQIP